jgi:hypothetical protein
VSVVDFSRFRAARAGTSPPQPPREPVFSVFTMEAGPSLLLTRDLFDLILIKLAFPDDPAESLALAEALVKAAYGEGAVLPAPPV